jgi:hypothetical protein
MRLSRPVHEPLVVGILVIVFCVCADKKRDDSTTRIVLEAERPTRQQGSQGKDEKKAASGGEVLGQGFGARPGHFAEYAFETKDEMPAARITVRYARGISGDGWLELSIDGKAVGHLRYEETGGWGDAEEQFRWASLRTPKVAAGKHVLRLTVVRRPAGRTLDLPDALKLFPAPVLDVVGNRTDKNCAGHGRNIALYVDGPSIFFYATHQLNDVFSAVDGGTVVWNPDHILVDPIASNSAHPNVNLDQIVINSDDGKTEEKAAADQPAAVRELRQVCVTEDDSVLSRIYLANSSDKAVKHRIEVAGDCRGSFDWRGKHGGEKKSEWFPDVHMVLLRDGNVFPDQKPGGLCIAVGGSENPVKVVTDPPGTYRLIYEVEIPAKGSKQLLLGCRMERSAKEIFRNLANDLQHKDPIADNRKEWQSFYDKAVPRFVCSDKGINELYAFRWYLLRFSSCGGDLGYFKYPVVLEGRQAYQTYCCYSAPFLAFDLNWAADPRAGFGQIATMAHAAYDDGRFPWYTSPRTNRVPIHHKSGTGNSLLPLAAWKHYLIHGDKKLLGDLYPGMKKNMDWWLSDRGSDGLFLVEDQLETGMDDLYRWGDDKAPPRYEAVDASSYAYVNLRAVEQMARTLGKEEDAKRLAKEAERTAQAVNKVLWDAKADRWRDRNPQTKKLADLNTITTFYPYFAGIGGKDHLGVFRKHLLNPDEFWLPHPVPALAKSDPRFKANGFWEGPSWPAATSHAVEAFTTSAKRDDRELLPKAAELFQKAMRNHLQPRADFFEKYNPLTGEPLSTWSDYMHSWWIDLIIRHAAGLMIQDDGKLVIDPLPLGLEYFALRGAPYRGHRVDVLWKSAACRAKEADFEAGLTVIVDGKEICRREAFKPGDAAVPVDLKE